MNDEERSEPRFLNAGEAALVVEYGQTIDPAIHARVVALDAAVNAARIEGIIETVPTFRSLMIHYDPLQISREKLVSAVLVLNPVTASDEQSHATWTIPCCYEGEFGEDVGDIARLAGISATRAVSLHTAAAYRVYMYGFAPGFCYLGGTISELAVSRRATPRPPTRPNVVLVAGGLSLISTVSMPTGWWIIGTTPERLYAPERDPIFLLAVGDSVRFEAIDRPTFNLLEQRAASGETVARRSGRG